MRCVYEIVHHSPEVVRIRDLDGTVSVTNDAELVVKELMQRAMLRPGMRLEYYDSEGNLDEITFDANGFTGFKVLPR